MVEFGNACIDSNNNLSLPQITGPTSFTTGSTVVLTASGVTGPYSWYFNNNLIPNQSRSTLSLVNATSAQAGAYSVKGSCSQVSAPFTLSLSQSTPVQRQLLRQQQHRLRRHLVHRVLRHLPRQVQRLLLRQQQHRLRRHLVHRLRRHLVHRRQLLH